MYCHLFPDLVTQYAETMADSVFPSVLLFSFFLIQLFIMTDQLTDQALKHACSVPTSKLNHEADIFLSGKTKKECGDLARRS